MANANGAAQQINYPWFESTPAVRFSLDFKVLAKDNTCYLLLHWQHHRTATPSKGTREGFIHGVLQKQDQVDNDSVTLSTWQELTSPTPIFLSFHSIVS